MARLDIRLLGMFQAKLDGEVLTGFRSDKARALLAFLAVEAGRPHRRDWLATLLWGNYDDRSARRSLSSALANLRQLLRPLGESAMLDADRSDIWLHATGEAIVVDVATWRQLVGFAETHSHRSLVHCQPCIQRFTQAAELYIGPFLSGLTFDDSPDFEEWQRTQQEVLHQQALHIMGTLAAHHLASDAYSRAEHYARRQISLQPWHEEGHRQLMLALAGAGQRNAALTQYELCLAILASELSVEPEERTTALFNRIRSGAALSFAPQSAGALASPFRGLQSFREVDAADFYGRESVTRQLTEAVSQDRLVALLGPSGSGKSSVLHAGLVHQLRHGSADNVRPRLSSANGKRARAWTICQVRPGSHPFHALAAAIAPHVKSLPRDAQGNQPDLAELLASGAVSLAHLLTGSMGVPNGSRLLLLLDQFEELYTLCADSDQRHAFIDLLLAAAAPKATGASLSVLLAVRADFMGQVLSHRALADALQDNIIMLGPMTREELADVIVKPAQALGIRLQDGLVARLLNDVGQTPGRLPLLEFALTQLWERQEEGFLTHEAYEAIGQVEGALAGYAEQVYAALNPAEQIASRRVFTQMVQLGQDTEDTRRPLVSTEVDAADWALVQRLADQRLVVTDFDPRGQQTAEIAHEALINGWGRLRHWINADRAFHLWQQRARLAADQWLDSERDQGALLRGAPLAEAEGWIALRPEDLSPKVLELIAASQAQQQREELEAEAGRQRLLAQAKALAEAEHQRAEVEASSNKRLRWLSASLSVVTLLALLAGLLAVLQRNEAVRQSDLAKTAQATANAERSIAKKEASIARSRQLAAQSLNLAGSAPDLSILLALHAMRLNDDPTENSALLLALRFSPLLSTVLQGQDSSSYSTAVSPDGRLLASGGENGLIWMWDLNTMQLIGAPWAGHEAPVYALVFGADSRLLASGDQNGVVRIWNAQSWQPQGAPLIGHESTISSLVFDSDGDSLLSVSEDGTAQWWHVASGTPLGQALPLARPNGVAVSPDGRLIAAKDGVTVTVQSAVDGSVLLPAVAQHSASIQDVVFSHDSSLLASASFDGSAVIWDIAADQLATPPLLGHDGRVLAVAFSPDASVLATGGTDAQIILWDVATGQRLGAPLTGHGNWVRTLAWTPDGQRLISGDAVGQLIVWEVGRLQRLAGHNGAVRGLSFTPDGDALVSSSFDQTVRVRDLASGRERAAPLTSDNSAFIHSVISPDGSFVAAGTGSGQILRWNPATGAAIGAPMLGHAGPIAWVAVSPDSRIIASAGFDQSIILWDAATGQPLGAPLLGHDNWVTSLAFSPDGRILASGSTDATVRLWDVASGQPVGQPLLGHQGWVINLVWSADGATLLSSSLDETVRFWDVVTGQPAGEPLLGHHAPVWGVAFNPADGGRSLITMGNNGMVVQWDLATRQIMAPPLWSPLETESMALSPDGSRLAIGAFDNSGVVYLWRLPAEPWQQRACAIANRDLTEEERTRYLGNDVYVPVCPSR